MRAKLQPLPSQDAPRLEPAIHNCWATRVVAFLLCGVVAVFANAQTTEPQVIDCGDNGYAVFKEKFVFGPGVRWWTWSPDGAYAAIQIESVPEHADRFGVPPPTKKRVSLVFWNKATRKADRVELPTTETSDDVWVSWLAGTQTALIAFDRTIEAGADAWRFKAVLYDARSNRTVILRDDDRRQIWCWYFASPREPVVVMVSYDLKDRTVSFCQFDLQGRTSKSAVYPKAVKFDFDTGFNRTGDSVILPIRQLGEPNTKVPNEFISYEVATGNLTLKTHSEAKFVLQEPVSEVSVFFEPAGSDILGAPNTAWLRAKNAEQRALVAEHCARADISPTGDCVLFMVNGVLFSRTVERIGASRMAEYREEQSKEAYLQQARQCALGILMYAADHDDNIPVGFNFYEEVYKYINSEDVMKGFVYTFVGGDFKDVDDPTRTELGHIMTPYGRAVAYADGHVGWGNPE